LDINKNNAEKFPLFLKVIQLTLGACPKTYKEKTKQKVVVIITTSSIMASPPPAAPPSARGGSFTASAGDLKYLWGGHGDTEPDSLYIPPRY